ncbi:hypothetical protein [Streptomyces sp. NPDC048248]|uniref:zinc finger domain-containing protein n=1 Tax=Streptomyces sp. NPDC048248 TaxID=3365523 RepID=UPI0037142EE7
MGVENELQQNATWGGEWRRHLRSGPELQLVRSWYRRIECPMCKAAAGRACRTGNGHPTDHHRARRDAAGMPPYEEWKQQGLWQQTRTSTMPAILKEAEKARTDYTVDVALGDAVAVIRLFLAEQLGLALGDNATFDRVDDAIRRLLQVRGPERSADLITVLGGLITGLLATAAGPDGNKEALFDSLIRTHVNEVRNAIHRQR